MELQSNLETLELTNNSEPNSDQHISVIYSKLSHKPDALGYITGFLSFSKQRKLFVAFTDSQFH